MKLNWNCTKKILLILNVTLVFIIIGCEKEYSPLTIQQELLKDIENLELKTIDFQHIAENE